MTNGLIIERHPAIANERRLMAAPISLENMGKAPRYVVKIVKRRMLALKSEQITLVQRR